MKQESFDESSYKNLKDFIKDNNIKFRKDIRKFSKEYKQFLKLPDEVKDSLLPTRDVITYDRDELKDFIKNNNIKTRAQFSRLFSKVYYYFKKLPKEDKESLLPRIKGGKEYIIPNTVEEFSDFIKENNIKTRAQLDKEFEGAYRKFFKVLTEEERNQILPVVRRDYSGINTLEDYQNYIIDNEINSKFEFLRKYSRLYSKFKTEFPSLLMDEVLPFKKKSKRTIWKEDVNSLEFFQKFIESNNITSPKEFNTKFPNVYTKLNRTFSTKERDYLVYPNRKRSFASIDTISELQNLIDQENICSRTELCKRFCGLYIKFHERLDEVKFNITNRSLGEKFIENFLINNNLDYEIEKKYSDLKDKGFLRYDFYIPKLNLLIEHHGFQHFNKNEIWYSEDLIKRDKIKYDYATEHNINIIYFTIFKKCYEDNGYFTEVLTDEETLLKRIKEIGLTNQSTI